MTILYALESIHGIHLYRDLYLLDVCKVFFPSEWISCVVSVTGVEGEEVRACCYVGEGKERRNIKRRECLAAAGGRGGE